MEAYKRDAEAWLHQHKQFSLKQTDAAASRLVFSLSRDATSKQSQGQFYVVCPSPNTHWHVWSDDSDLLVKLSHVTDNLERLDSVTLHHILDHTAKVLVTGASTQSSSSSQQNGHHNAGDKNVDDSDDEFEDADDDTCDDDDDDVDCGDNFFDDDYYKDDEDCAEGAEAKSEDDSSDDDDDLSKYLTQGATMAAVQRIYKDHKSLSKSEGKFGVIGKPCGNNLFVWEVQLTDFDKASRLGKDLQEYAKKFNRERAVTLRMIFPGNYPMAPPFVRVIRPRFKFLTGHITVGGSICMEMLTKSGWRPTNDIESILVQIRSEIMSDKNAGLDDNPDREYSEQEAKVAFTRMVQRYGWDK